MSEEPEGDPPPEEEPDPAPDGEGEVDTEQQVAGEGEQPPAEPLPDQADPNDPMVFGAEPTPDPDPNDPNTYPTEDSPIGGGPLYRRTGP